MEEEVRARATLVDDLRAGIARGELELHYQPQVELSSGAIAGVEGLVRWRHPASELILPGAFIGEAERSGLIFDVDSWVLGEACRRGRAWLDEGAALGTISVNVSGAMLKRGAPYLQLLEQTLRATGFPPQRLELEMSDSLFTEPNQAFLELLQGMRRIGIRIAIDGFGMGYSSLEYLRLFPVERIKLARHLVSGLPDDRNTAPIVETVIKLAAALRSRLVAVGIENGEQLCFLRTHGCAEGQGYYLSPPVPPESARTLIRSGRLHVRSQDDTQQAAEGSDGR